MMMTSRQPPGPDSTNVAEVWSADTDTVLPCHLSRKSTAFQSGGSHGLNVMAVPDTESAESADDRLPGSACGGYVDALGGVPLIVEEIDECRPAGVLDGAAGVADLNAHDG